ncbi:hypothetical protein BU15DRAFT_78207 [Melanogaster broomeanus]|nr:hypothetical protein BU15DRAFT_78207 [Melanogaster broomeanus]
MVQWLVDHPVDCIVLFSEDKSTPHPQGQPSGSNKQEIYGVITKIIFDGDPEYGGLFTSQPAKFSEVVQNHIGILKRLYRDQAKKFQQTGNGIAPIGISEGDSEYNNLLESILEAFPWYMDLHGLWKGIPSIPPKTAINSTPGISCSTQLLSIVKKTSTATALDSPSEPPMSDRHTHTANEPSQESLAHPDLNDPPVLPPDDEAAPTPSTDKYSDLDGMDVDYGYYDDDNEGMAVDEDDLGGSRLAGKK